MWSSKMFAGWACILLMAIVIMSALISAWGILIVDILALLSISIAYKKYDK